uniref:FTH domain-containing protein n=1 Tax=Caenorhabditis tropicalis TaxID=1561998 RepID=A0A1I7T2T0_9PELO
ETLRLLSPIQVTNLEISFVDPTQILRILPLFDLKSNLTLTSTGLLEKYDFGAIQATPQWQGAKKIEIRRCFVGGPVSGFMHLESAIWTMSYVLWKNFLEIKEAFSVNPKLEHIGLNFQKNHVTLQFLIEKLGAPNTVTWNRILTSQAWFIRIPDTDQVIHLDVLYQGTIPMHIRFMRKPAAQMLGKFTISGPLPCTHTEIILDWVFGAIRENFRRCSVWLGLSLTVIRTVSVKMAANKTFDFVNSAKTGRYSIFIVVLVSSGFSIGYLMRYHIVKSTVAFVPDEGCPELDSDLRYPYQIVELSKTNSFLIGSARQIHLVSTAIFGKILPSILFPISALILILELRKTRRMQTGNKKISDKNNRLVVYMTISFIVIELPIGICKLVTMTEETYEDSIIPESIVELLNVIYVSMTTTHFFICFAMSSQYRNTVKGVLRIPTKVSRRMFSQFSSSER